MTLLQIKVYNIQNNIQNKYMKLDNSYLLASNEIDDVIAKYESKNNKIKIKFCLN